MTDLFGIDIAGLIADAMGDDLIPGTLTKVTPGTRDPAALAGGTRPSSRSYQFSGIVEDYRDSQIDGTNIVRGDRRVLILAGTLQRGIRPEGSDKVKIEGVEYYIVGVPARDPATATYSCQVRGS